MSREMEGVYRGKAKAIDQGKTSIPWAMTLQSILLCVEWQTKDVRFYVKELLKIGAPSFYIV